MFVYAWYIKTCRNIDCMHALHSLVPIWRPSDGLGTRLRITCIQIFEDARCTCVGDYATTDRLKTYVLSSLKSGGHYSPQIFGIYGANYMGARARVFRGA